MSGGNRIMIIITNNNNQLLYCKSANNRLKLYEYIIVIFYLFYN